MPNKASPAFVPVKSRSFDPRWNTIRQLWRFLSLDDQMIIMEMTRAFAHRNGHHFVPVDSDTVLPDEPR